MTILLHTPRIVLDSVTPIADRKYAFSIVFPTRVVDLTIPHATDLEGANNHILKASIEYCVKPLLEDVSNRPTLYGFRPGETDFQKSAFNANIRQFKSELIESMLTQFIVLYREPVELPVSPFTQFGEVAIPLDRDHHITFLNRRTHDGKYQFVFTTPNGAIDTFSIPVEQIDNIKTSEDLMKEAETSTLVLIESLNARYVKVRWNEDVVYQLFLMHFRQINKRVK